MENILEKIMLKAYKINKETKHKIFINFSGHVNSLNVRIYRNGWEPNKEPNIDEDIFLDKNNVIKKLEEILREFEKLEKDNYIFTTEELKTIRRCLLTTKRTLKCLLFNRDKEQNVKEKIYEIDKLLMNF